MIRRTVVICEKGGLFAGSSDHALSIKTLIMLLPGSSLGSLSSLTRGRNVFTVKCKEENYDKHRRSSNVHHRYRVNSKEESQNLASGQDLYCCSKATI